VSQSVGDAQKVIIGVALELQLQQTCLQMGSSGSLSAAAFLSSLAGATGYSSSTCTAKSARRSFCCALALTNPVRAGTVCTERRWEWKLAYCPAQTPSCCCDKYVVFFAGLREMRGIEYHSEHSKPHRNICTPPQSLHWLLRWLCSQILMPPQSLQELLSRLCWQMLAPPQSLHRFLSWLCWQMLAPPQSLQMLLSWLCCTFL
jgi:hypothetical protein